MAPAARAPSHNARGMTAGCAQPLRAPARRQPLPVPPWRERPPHAHAASAPPFRVAVRHARAGWSLRVDSLAQAAPAAAQRDAPRQFRLLLATAEGLLHEAGAGFDQVVSCEVFVREPAARRAVAALLHAGATRWPAPARLVHPPQGALPEAGMGVALVVAQPQGDPTPATAGGAL